MAAQKSAAAGKKISSPYMPRFNPEILREIEKRQREINTDQSSANQLSRRAGFEPYQWSRWATGKQALQAAACLQIAGTFNLDFREFMHEPKGDAQEIIREVRDQLAEKLKSKYETGEGKNVYMTDPYWITAEKAHQIVIVNDEKTFDLKNAWEKTAKEINVELALLRNVVKKALIKRSGYRGDFYVDDPKLDIQLIDKRALIDKSLDVLDKIFFDQNKLPYVDPKFQIDAIKHDSLRSRFNRLLAQWGDEEALEIVLQDDFDHAELWGSLGDRTQPISDAEISSATEAEPVADSVILAPPPPAHAAQTSVKNLPQYGQARAGRDGFHLPAGADAMSYLSRPYFLHGVASAYAVYCNGDNMEPRYRHGELLFVDPSRPPKRGDDVVIQVAAGDEISGFVKRFVGADDETTTVHQLNPDKDIEYPTANVRAVHLIVGSLVAGVS